MNNIKIYNKCKTDLILGYQLEKTSTNYTLGKTLSAASNIGKRSNQEDSVIILEHSENDKIKLLAVADGVGGAPHGEQASSYTLQRITEKFEMLSANYYNDKNIELIRRKFCETIAEINYNILKQNYGATTLSAAIITENNTIIFNIGDSRIYTCNNNQLHQETRDDSIVQELFDIKEIPNKDLMRFHNRSNIILNCLGDKNMYINTKIIPNNYDLLIGTTDGVTDFLSEKEIEEIIKINKSDNLSEIIANKAAETTSINHYMKNIYQEDYMQEKKNNDNATVAILKRK